MNKKIFTAMMASILTTGVFISGCSILSGLVAEFDCEGKAHFGLYDGGIVGSCTANNQNSSDSGPNNSSDSKSETTVVDSGTNSCSNYNVVATVGVGDSLTSQWPINYPQAWPNQLTLAPLDGPVYNTSFPGQTCTGGIYNAQNQIKNVSGPGVLTTFGLLACSNDVYYQSDAATTMIAMKVVVASLRQRGPVVIATWPDRWYSSDTTRQTWSLQQAALVRTEIVNTWQTWADGMADLAADSRIGLDGARNNTTYFLSDKVHFSAAGAAVVGSLMDPELDRVRETIKTCATDN